MRKGQSLVIQFLLFFLIGFSIFLSIGSFFRYQLDLLRWSIISSAANLTSSYISSAAILVTDSCKQCDFVRLNLETYNFSTGGYPIEVKIENNELEVFAGDKGINSSIHNLNYTLSLTPSHTSISIKPISLTFNRSNYNLEVR